MKNISFYILTYKINIIILNIKNARLSRKYSKKIIQKEC